MEKFNGHTELPWHATENELGEGFNLFDIDGKVFVQSKRMPDDEVWNDADFIVESCNSYYDLKARNAELVECLKFMKQVYPYSPPCHNWELQVKAHNKAKQLIEKNGG
jgi:hypothetical protein